MKKFILLTVLICGFLAVNAQKTTPGNYTYIAQQYEWIPGIFQGLGLPAGSGPAAFRTGQVQRAGAVYYDSLGADAGFYFWDGVAWVLQGSPGAVALPDELIQPGYVTYSGTGLKFYISPSIARIGGVLYGTDYDSVTLSASDPDDPRKDVIYVATTGIEVLTGTPAGPAAEPQLSAGQIKLTVIDIPALATTPGLTQLPLWDENTEGSVVTNVGTTTDPDNLTNVYHLTKSINVTSINGGDEIIITPSSTINLNAFDGISLFLKLKAILPPTVSITIAGFLTGVQVTPEIGLGFNRNFLPYQGVSLAMTRLTSGASNTFIDKIRFRFAGTATVQAGFYLDYIYLESGVLQPGGSGTPVTIGPIDSQIPSPNGLTANNNVITAQTASQTNPGLLSPADKTKLDSIHSDYFIENEGDGEELATQVNDSTVGIKSLKPGTNVTLDVTDTTITINSTGGAGSGGIQDAIDSDNVLTKADTIDLNSQFLTFLNGGGVGIGGVPNSLFRVGVGINSYIISDPTNNRYEFGDLNGLLNSTYMSIDDGNSNIDFNANGAMRWGADTLATRAYSRSVGGGSSYTDADARAAISLTTTGTSGVATYNSGTGVLNVPDYSGGAAIWSGVVIGTSFSATSTTISTAAVQWTFTGSSPATFTLPARTSSVNQFYTIKNIGSADLTVAAAGTDDIFTTASVASITVVPGGSVMITGAANGTSDLWTALFHTGTNTTANLRIDRTYTAIPTFFIRTSDTTLIMKDIGGATDVLVTSLPDSTIDIALGSNVVKLSGTQTLSNKRWVPRVGSTTSSGTPTINTDNFDIYKLTAQTADITSFTTNLTGTPNDGDVLEIQVTGTAARAITWGASFVASTVALPTTTVTTATLSVVFQYFTTSSYGNNTWVCVNSF